MVKRVGKKGLEDALMWTIIILATLVVVLVGIGILSGKFGSAIKYISDLLSSQ